MALATAQANADYVKAPASVRAMTQLIVVIVTAPASVRAVRDGAPVHKGSTTTNARIAPEKEWFGTTTNGAYMQEITTVNVQVAKERAMRVTG